MQLRCCKVHKEGIGSRFVGSEELFVQGSRPRRAVPPLAGQALVVPPLSPPQVLPCVPWYRCILCTFLILSPSGVSFLEFGCTVTYQEHILFFSGTQILMDITEEEKPLGSYPPLGLATVRALSQTSHAFIQNRDISCIQNTG